MVVGEAPAVARPPGAGTTSATVLTSDTPGQAPLPSSTDSTASGSTLRGLVLGSPSANLPMTPSYPFPRMDPPISNSPLKTPEVQPFVPFTALSPTTEPPSIKLAKAKLAQDFKASGHMRLAMGGGSMGGGSQNSAQTGYLPPCPPDNLKISIQLQSEPGLKAWWSSVCQIAKESFGAERASLAVPSDLTDIENVPWVQLATFRGASEDALSRLTNERTSDRSNLTEISLPSRARRAGKPEAKASSKTGHGPSVSLISAATISNNKPNTPNAAKTVANKLLTARPKLELRHSYAGYPVNDKVSSQDFALQAKALPKRPRVLRASSSTAAGDQLDQSLELNEEALEKHDQAYEGQPASEYAMQRTTGGGGVGGGGGGGSGHATVLDVVQPLESDADALIDGSGIFKVMHRGVPVLLTRQYREIAGIQKGTDVETMKLTGKQPASTPNRQRPRAGPAARSKSHTKTALRTLEESPEKRADQTPYEDYEQVPQSPWSQSPAPSPAARVETGDNPFFPSAGALDESAFDDQHNSHTDSDPHSTQVIPAIGFDKASTIIQIPLIHPHTRAIQQQQQQQQQQLQDRRSTRSAAASIFSPNQDDSIPSGTHNNKYAPVAILSLLIPVVPYPIYLSHSLTELSPLLAATFVSARKHSSLVRQIESLSRKRRFTSGMASELSFHTESSDLSRTIELSPANSFHDPNRPFSPIGTDSPSDQSRPSNTPSEGQPERSWQVSTPGLVHVGQREGHVSGRKTPGTPSITMETSGSYFVQDGDRVREETSTTTSTMSITKTTVKKVTTTSREPTLKDNSRLHSQGANFAATHPALPTATSTTRVSNGATSSSASGSSEPQLTSFDVGSGAAPEHDFHSVTSIKPSVSMLQTMIDNGAAQQWISAGSDGSILWANAKFLVYRQSKGEDLDDEFWESILPKERQAFRLAWSSALQTGEQFSRSCRLRRFNGQYRWFSIRVIPIKDRHGVTKFFHGQAMDIHDQREAERSVHRAKEHRKYRTLANSIPVIVFAAHVPTGITYANSQWLLYSGQSEDEYKGFGFLDHVHPDDLTKCRFPGFGGNPFPNGDGDGSGESRHPLYRHDSSTSNASSNAESEGTVATQDTARPDKKVTAAGEDDDRHAYVPGNLLKQLADEGIVMCEKDGQGNLSISMEMRLKSKTGEYRWHVVSGSYIDSVDFGSGDAPAQWFLTATDITSQKQTEARIADAKLALENANSKLAQEVKSKMSYLSSMSHEIRTPLSGIIGNLQFLINTGLGEEAYDWAHGAKDAATNMSELINDVLDLSKAEANMLHLSSHIFSPREITENVLDQLNSKVTERRLELSVEIDPRVPTQLKGDSGRIRQVLLNLVGNAVKFTPTGEIWVSCDLVTTPRFDLPRLGDNERFVEWKICDTGKGFSEADKAYLFKEYSQIKKRKDRDIGGTGLGLILCKTMVELHGGKIDAKGEPGKGACFSFFARFKVAKSRSRASATTMASSKTATSKNHAGDGPKTSSSSSSSSAPSRGVVEPPSPAKGSFHYSPSPLNPASTASKPGSISSFESISPIPSASTGKLTNGGGSQYARVPFALTSPAVSSAGSSTVSVSSTHFAQSIRSSSSLSSTNEARAAVMTLTLPDKDERSSGSDSGSDSINSNSTTVFLDSPTSPRAVQMKLSSEVLTPGLETVTFRPPLFSVLLYCPSSNARRIMADQIQYVVPKTVPCHLKPEAELSRALDLLSGEDAMTFSHVVVRSSTDDEALRFVDKVLGSEKHQHTCLVLVTSQAQMQAVTEQRPDIDIKAFQRQEKLLVLQKPCHTYKLSKIFDPLRENDAVVEDPQAAKRREEKRAQRESYALFRRELGERRLRVLAVEDNPVQMNVLTSFLGKICGLEIKTAFNGLEALETIKAHPAGHFSAVVSDIEMPIMGGYEMVRELRKWEASAGRPATPTVSLSANTVKEGWAASAEAGFSHYTPKPVNFMDLGNVLLEVTQPGQPHKFLRDRPLPRELSGEQSASSDDESDEEEGEE